ncbi:hypothetical protein D1BOALGB6SA_5243 [Olavius sp. associated proteobacterium Delta 1]|nr:hypothetical protein D1BOALGB6SA_5243 [Olavius sp. associated proteobacterium Delta 1]
MFESLIRLMVVYMSISSIKNGKFKTAYYKTNHLIKSIKKLEGVA